MTISEFEERRLVRILERMCTDTGAALRQDVRDLWALFGDEPSDPEPMTPEQTWAALDDVEAKLAELWQEKAKAPMTPEELASMPSFGKYRKT